MSKEPFELRGRVEAVLTAMSHGAIASTRAEKIAVVRGHGIAGDRHAGARLADVRETALLSFGLMRGTEIANHRQFSAVSIEDLSAIGTAMGLTVAVPHGCLGENLIVSGIPKLTELPSGTMLFFRRDEARLRTAVLAVWGENAPCLQPGEVIQRHFPEISGLAARFPKAAAGRRGIVGSVYCSGHIHAGDEIIVKIPRQRLYDP